MTIIQLATPLEWPQYMPVTDRLARMSASNFPQDIQEHEALTFLQDEVNRTPQIFSAVLFCNALNINSTMQTQYLSKNPGVSLRVAIDGNYYMLSCDRWSKLSHNIYALHLALRYYRQLEDWGMGSLAHLMVCYSLKDMEKLFSSNGGGNGMGHEWREILSLGGSATLDDANAMYRHKAKVLGESDPDALQVLNLAIQHARQHFEHG